MEPWLFWWWYVNFFSWELICCEIFQLIIRLIQENWKPNNKKKKKKSNGGSLDLANFCLSYEQANKEINIIESPNQY